MFEIFSRLGKWLLATLRGSEDGSESGTLHVLKTDSDGRLAVTLAYTEMELDDLNDVSAAAPSQGDLLRYDTGEWVNDTLALNDLADVDDSLSPTDGQSLIYDAYMDNWVAADSTVDRKILITADCGWNSTDGVALTGNSFIAMPVDDVSYISGKWIVPDGFTGNLKITALGFGSSAGNGLDVRLYAVYKWGSIETGYWDSNEYPVTPTQFTFADLLISEIRELCTHTISSGITPGDVFSLNLVRYGDNVADTFDSDLYFIGWVLEFTETLYSPA